MPRSSRHKSHKQSKHSSKDAKEYYSDSDEEYVRMKDKDKDKQRSDGAKEEGGSGSVRVSKDSSSYSASGEKRKLSSSSLLKDGKDLSGNENGDAAGEEYIPSKRRKDKAEGDGKDESFKIDHENGRKSKESNKGLFGDSKIKSNCKRHESGRGEEEDRSESRRKSSEKESGKKEGKDSLKEVKDREREKKVQESKRDSELSLKKEGLNWDDSGEERQGKKVKEDHEVPIQEDFRNLELEKELEKRIRRRPNGSSDRDKGLDARESDEKYMSSRIDHKDGKYKDEKVKDGFYGDKNQDVVEKDDRHRDLKYREDADTDAKYRDIGDRDYRYDKYREDGEKDNRRREDKYRGDVDWETRRKDDKYRDDSERDNRRREDKYREDGERENKHREDRYCEDGDKSRRRNDDKHYEDAEKDDKYRDDKYRDDSDRYKDDKRREEYERDIKQKDGKVLDDVDREKRSRDSKYKDEHGSKDRSGDKSDVKRSRDDVNITDHSLKSSTRDTSPTYDDRSRLKDDQVRKRKLDKEDYSDIKSRSAKDQRYDTEKKSTSNARIDLSSERGRSTPRNTDLDGVPSRSRHQRSPSSAAPVTREHYRLSKQDESKYREYAYEDRSRHSGREYPGPSGATDKVTSSRASEMNVQKDDILSKSSPRQLIDKSPSSINVDRSHVSRSGVRWSIDIEESGQRSGCSRDAKDYYRKEGRGNRDFPKDPNPGDNLPQAEGDNLSVSSPFVRPGHFGSRSHVPPFRTVVDGPSNFGSTEDDNRMKFNNRHRRISDPNLARVPGSPWNPSWPSQIANGFVPFQHAPAPVGPQLVMPQFPLAHFINLRPSTEINLHGVPYHIPDSERFSGHGRPIWRTPMDDSYPPPHVWDANNALFSEEPHVYGRPEWDHNRSIPGVRGFETSSNMWKVPKGDTGMDMQFASEKESRSAEAVQNDEIPTDILTEIHEPNQSSDALEKKSPENTTKIAPTVALVSRRPEKENANHYHVYLSKLDISADLADPELYSKCTDLMDVDRKIFSDEGFKVLYVQEAAENDIWYSKSSTSLFTNVSDSIFQKAITLYRKQREEFVVIRGENQGLSKLCIKTEVESDQRMDLLDDHKVDNASQGSACPSNNEEVKQQSLIEPKLENISTEGNQELDEPVVAIHHELGEPVVADDVEKPEKVMMVLAGTKDGLPSDLEPLKAVEVPGNLMAANHLAGTGEDREMAGGDTKCEPLVLSSTKGCEVVMTESIESGSVNLSRIHHHHHHSPESTH